MPPTVSIVTVCLDEGELIANTLESIISQIGIDTEIIVIDGGSSDATLKVVNTYAKYIKTIISEPDQGIFDGMNKGLQFAKGDWFVFMNGGDRFANSDALQALLEDVPDHAEVVYGNRWKTAEPEYPFPLRAIEYGVIPFCHQAAAFRLDKDFSGELYDLSYKIYADYVLVLDIYCRDKSVFHYVNKNICASAPGGISSSISYQKRKDKYRALYKYYGVRGVCRGLLAKMCGFYTRR